MSVVALVGGGVVLVVATIALVFVVGMQRRSPTVIKAVRRLARATRTGPLKSAGRSSAYASIVRHVGRRSGREYETPVRAVSTADGFAIALPYGSDSDWVKNVRTRGSAVIVHDDHTYHVTQPLLVPLEVAENNFSAKDQRAHRLFGVTECLLVHRSPEGEPPEREVNSIRR